MAQRYDNPLKNLKVASPCSQDWNAMDGDNRKRYCGECKLNVYNLSGMTSYDAENLLRLAEGRLCVRYFQRPDGTVLTQDCPVGWARVKRRLSVAAAAAFGVFLSLVGALGISSAFGRKQPIIGKIIPVSSPTPDRTAIMGAVALPSPKVSPSPTPTPDGRWVVGDIDVRPTTDPEPKIDQELKKKVLRQAGV